MMFYLCFKVFMADESQFVGNAYPGMRFHSSVQQDECLDVVSACMLRLVSFAFFE